MPGPNAGLRLAEHRRKWANFKSALGHFVSDATIEQRSLFPGGLKQTRMFNVGLLFSRPRLLTSIKTTLSGSMFVHGGNTLLHPGLGNNPTNTRHRPNVGSLLVCRLWRWPNIDPALSHVVGKLRWWGDYYSKQHSWNQCWLNVKSAAFMVDQYGAIIGSISGIFWLNQPWPVIEATVLHLNLRVFFILLNRFTNPSSLRGKNCE